MARPATSAGTPSSRGDHMVGNVAQLVEPPQAQLGQDAALVRDFAGEHVVVGADPVAGHHQDLVLRGPRCGQVRRYVQVADLAGVDVGPAGQLRGRSCQVSCLSSGPSCRRVRDVRDPAGTHFAAQRLQRNVGAVLGAFQVDGSTPA